MRRNRLAPFLRRVDRGLHVKRYSNRGEHVLHGGNDAVYYYRRFVGAVPVGNIYVHGHERYRGLKYRNRSLRGLVAQIRRQTPLPGHKLRKVEHVIQTAI